MCFVSLQAKPLFVCDLLLLTPSSSMSGHNFTQRILDFYLASRFSLASFVKAYFEPADVDLFKTRAFFLLLAAFSL